MKQIRPGVGVSFNRLRAKTRTPGESDSNSTSLVLGLHNIGFMMAEEIGKLESLSFDQYWFPEEYTQIMDAILWTSHAKYSAEKIQDDNVPAHNCTSTTIVKKIQLRDIRTHNINRRLLVKYKNDV